MVCENTVNWANGKKRVIKLGYNAVAIIQIQYEWIDRTIYFQYWRATAAAAH
jgi:hypothetical protein